MNMLLRAARRCLAVALLGLTILTLVTVGAMATGRVGYVVTNGVSMNPVYFKGDLVVVAKAESYHIGQIVAYRMLENREVVLHRIIEADANGFVMKGDNNQSIDSTRPRASEMVGRAVLHLPHVGIWLNSLTSPAVLGLTTFILMASSASQHIRHRRRSGTMSRHTSTGPDRSRSTLLATAPPWLRTAAAGAAVVGILGLVLSAFAWNGPVTKQVSGEESSNRSMTFAYSAAVAKTAAYDTTTATSPDPIFRSVTNTVDVKYSYEGAPGRLSVNAELSTGSGWHSTIPLTDAVDVSGKPVESTIRLDLVALDARARAAATATGMPSDQLIVSVVPLVKNADGTTFAPALDLTLTPTQLRMVGDATSLTVKDTSTVTTTTSTPRSLAIAGRSIPVATARIVGASFVGSAAVVGALLLLILVRTSPSTEGADIRRRYAPLLLAVEPMPTPSGRPIVDVVEFATLAKLAERYGLLVLHWKRTGVATFVVHDEGMTYRYRTNTDLSHEVFPGPEVAGDSAEATVPTQRDGSSTAPATSS